MSFLTENAPFYFATVDGDKPKVRPFGFTMEYQGKLYFGLGKHKLSYKQLMVNPNVEISTANKKGQWIRISGTVVFDDRPEVLEKAFATMPQLKDIYNEKTGLTMAMCYIKDGVAEIADLKGNFERIEF